MEIKFNLKDAMIYIPSGRLMNLKESLGWTDVKCTKEEIAASIEPLVDTNFNVDVNYEQSLEKHVSTTFKSSHMKVNREEMYKSIGRKQIMRPEFFAESTHNLIETMKEDIPEMCKKTMGHPQIIKLLDKLQKLKEINGTQ